MTWNKKVFVLILFCFSKSQACGLAWGEGEAPVLMHAEKAMIIWNSQTQRQDFIREVNFESESENVGFIVPVPSIPEVEDVADNLFEEINQKMEEMRPTRYVFGYSRNLTKDEDKILQDGHLPGVSDSARGVEIVAQFYLADYEVKVLKAQSLEPLVFWLQENDFELRPALKNWLSHYIHRESFFTVFKFRKDEDRESFKTKAVRISFAAKKPFYPYRDSEDMVLSPQRKLTLFLLADQYYVPDFHYDKRLLSADGWSLEPMFSSQIALPKGIKKIGLTDPMWLTVWEDSTQKRPNRDLFFSPLDGQSKIVLLDPIQIDITPFVILGVMALVFLMFLFGLLILGRKLYRKLKGIL